MSLKLYSLSDLHLEFYKDEKELWSELKGKIPDADVLILAGDIGYPLPPRNEHYLSLLKLFKGKYKHVLLIPGNHEYYPIENFNRKSAEEALYAICKEADVTLLLNSSVDIEGVRFIGTTLWSRGDPSIKYRIADFGKVFSDVKEYNKEFTRCYGFLLKKLAEDEDMKKVVITHHLPTSRLIHP